MLEALRGHIASGLITVANRMTTEPRFPGASRVPAGLRTLAGVPMSPDQAVTISAVWACLRYISQTVAILPWNAAKKTRDWFDLQEKHPVDWLISERPSKEFSSFQFRELLAHWALRWGNGIAEIEPDQLGRPSALWPIHPDRVQFCRATEPEDDAYGTTIEEGELYYEVTNGTGGKVVLAASNVFHIRGFGEGPVGVNVIQYASESLGYARAVQLHGASFFGNGMNISGVVINKKPLKPDGLKRQKAEFDQLYKGPRNANKTAFLDNDADWKPIGIDPKNSQLIDVHYMCVEEVCRWFGVPPHKVMHLLRATFSNIEHQSIEVVQDSIRPWSKRFEDEGTAKLFGQQNRQRLVTHMDLRELLKADTAARIAYYEGMVRIGAFSPNDVRLREGDRPIGPEGDIHVMQSQNVTLKSIADGTAAAVSGGMPSKSDAAPTPPEIGVDEATQAHLGRRMYAIEEALSEPAHG